MNLFMGTYWQGWILGIDVTGVTTRSPMTLTRGTLTGTFTGAQRA